MFQKHRPLRISEPTSTTMVPVCPSPDSVLKCPAEVLSDLNETEDFCQNLIEEQKAIEAGKINSTFSFDDKVSYHNSCQITLTLPLYYFRLLFPLSNLICSCLPLNNLTQQMRNFTVIALVDLAMQKLSPTVITLMKVSKSVADELKTGVDVIRPVIPEATRMESMNQSPRSPSSRKRTRENAQDPKGKKKQHSD
ncbi:hypothetical protein LINGRAHAP2_LOCUS20309 [Linum grandiflorum]